jgi:hypothetical protein
VRRSRTIIFDHYGTLLPGGSRLQRDTIAFQMADVLEVDRKKFADVVRDTFDERVRGTMGGPSETISELAQRVGGSPASRQVALAADQRLEFSILARCWSGCQVRRLRLSSGHSAQTASSGAVASRHIRFSRANRDLIPRCLSAITSEHRDSFPHLVENSLLLTGDRQMCIGFR